MFLQAAQVSYDKPPNHKPQHLFCPVGDSLLTGGRPHLTISHHESDGVLTPACASPHSSAPDWPGASSPGPVQHGLLPPPGTVSNGLSFNTDIDNPDLSRTALSHLHKLSPRYVLKQTCSARQQESKPDHVSTSDDLPVCLSYETAGTQLILLTLTVPSPNKESGTLQILDKYLLTEWKKHRKPV